MSEITTTNSSASQTLKDGNPEAAAVSAPAVQRDQWEGQLSSQIVIEPARGWIALNLRALWDGGARHHQWPGGMAAGGLP